MREIIYISNKKDLDKLCNHKKECLAEIICDDTACICGKIRYNPLSNNITTRVCQRLFENMTTVQFDDMIDCPVDNLPDGINYLTFGKYFNHPVDNLPSSITHITFGDRFNQPVDNLPKNIKILNFGNNFNQPVDKLPNNILSLIFGW